MLLSLKQAAHLHQPPKSFHDSRQQIPPASISLPPAVTVAALTPPSTRATGNMATQHRGLPPPAAMTLPAPAPSQPPQGPPPMPQPMAQPVGQLPAPPVPPAEWRNAEESMRNWLQAKQEEDRRKQEEEKTRQEGLRLEQRRIEQSMLHESLQGGIPPYLIPMVFAGMGGGNLPQASLEWAQNYMVQLHQLHQQPALPQPHSSPDARRESRINTVHQSPYTPQQQSMTHPLPGSQASTPAAPVPQQGTLFPPNYSVAGMSPPYGQRPEQAQNQPLAFTSAPRPPPHGGLSRLNTGEIQPQPLPPGPTGMPRGVSVHSLQQQQPQAGPVSGPTSSQDPNQPSPSTIYFHHWVPPSSQPTSKESKDPGTPSDYTNSPRKRRAQGPHQEAPRPSNQQSQTSPSFSQTGSVSSNTGRRGGHGRARSDSSSRYDPLARPSSRSRLSEGNGGGSGGGGGGSAGPAPSGPHESGSTSTSEVSGTSHPSPGYRSSQRPQGQAAHPASRERTSEGEITPRQYRPSQSELTTGSHRPIKRDDGEG